jgi:uncharacterized protein (TIGR03437 family)
MWRIVFALLFLAYGLAAQTVRITWVGQACFYVATEGGPVVAVDPPAANLGYPLPATPADAVAISHNHGDHNNSAGVRGNFTLVDGRPVTERATVTVAGVPFVQIPGFHDNTNGSQRGRNTIVQWTQGGLRFAHFGDHGQDSLTPEQLADLRDLDVMMVPAGGFFTIDSHGTAALIDQVKPRVAILMHFRTALGGAAQTAAFPAVAGAFPNIRFRPATVALSRESLPSSPEVWIMEPLAPAAVVNLAGEAPGVPVAPGSLAAVSGPFTGSATAAASSQPLPLILGETEARIGTEAVPLLAVSPARIHFQVPAALTPGQRTIEVRVAGQAVARGTITTVARSPGLFAVVDAENRLGRGRRGGVVTVYGTGQGSAEPAAEPDVWVGGRRATALYSGPAPGFTGLWQINAVLAGDTPAGDANLEVFYDLNLVSNPLPITVE